MSEDILAKAKALLGDSYTRKELPAASPESVARAKEALKPQGSLDVYIVFDTTGSMSTYINQVKADLAEVTSSLLDEKSDIRLSMNGIGDHCDGNNWLQMYALTNQPEEVRGSIESIVMTDGGDTPEAYECMAFAMSRRLPEESKGRKRAVVLIADSVPHGMIDAPCSPQIDYKEAFEALKTVCDGFYFVGCEEQNYAHQRKLIDSTKKDKEQFIPLGSMIDTLPHLLVALAKKAESAKALSDYLKRLELEHAEQATAIRGLLGR